MFVTQSAETILKQSWGLILPLAYGVALFIGLQLLWRLLRRISLLRGLHITCRLLALVAGMILFLQQAGLLKGGLRAGVVLTGIMLTAVVVLHMGEALFLLPYQRQGRQAPIPRLMRDILKGLLLIFTLLVTISQLFQIQLGTVLLSSTVFTAVVGLALQDLLKNVFAGIALQLERPFEPGDWVSVDGQEGKVLEMSWRAIRLETRDWFQIIVPSGVVAQQRVSNYAGVIARHIKLPIDGTCPPNKVKEVLREAALAAPGVVSTPQPLVRVTQFSAATTHYDLKYWIKEFDRLPDIESDILTNVWYYLGREGLRIADTEMVLLDLDEIAARHGPPEPATIAAALRRVDLFSTLSDAEMETLARSARVVRYGVGETLTRQGAVEDTLFVVHEGLVRVEIAGENGDAPVVLKTLAPGKVFGEFGLLTGEPRSATVVAQQDTLTVVISRQDLAPILERNSALPGALGKVLARRAAERTEVLARRAASEAEEIAVGSRSITSRIRNLFGLSGG